MIRIIEKAERLKRELKELYSNWDGKCLSMESDIQDIEGELDDMGVDYECN